MTGPLPRGTGRGERYSTDHDRERAKWAPIVAQGRADCAQPICLEEADGRGRIIVPGTEWDLGHDAAGVDYIGPTHRRCNRSAAGTVGALTVQGRAPELAPAAVMRRQNPRGSNSREW